MLETDESICSQCGSSFSCGVLATALRIADRYAGWFDANPDKAKELSLVIDQLKAAGWAYPRSKTHCKFADNCKDISSLTSRLIKLTSHASQMSSAQSQETGELDR